MGVGHENAITSSTQMILQWWHRRQAGSIINKKRCLNFITIYGNGKSVKAMVVDECDSTMGCDADHDYQPPCPHNVVDASKAVWDALGVPKGKSRGNLDIYWSDV